MDVSIHIGRFFEKRSPKVELLKPNNIHQIKTNPVGLGDIRIVNLGEVGLEEGKDAEIKSGSEARHSSTSIGGELLETISLRRDDDPQHEAAR